MASVSRSLSLLSPSFYLERAIRLVDPRVTFALQRCCLPQFCVHGDWFIHVSTVLNSCCEEHPPVLEHRCVECSPLATTCQSLRCNLSLLEKRCQSVLAIAIEQQYNMELLRRHELGRMMERARTRVRCRRCPGNAEHNFENPQKLVHVCGFLISPQPYSSFRIREAH